MTCSVKFFEPITMRSGREQDVRVTSSRMSNGPPQTADLLEVALHLFISAVCPSSKEGTTLIAVFSGRGKSPPSRRGGEVCTFKSCPLSKCFLNSTQPKIGDQRQG